MKCLQEIRSGGVECNLKGYALGNTWVDPVESILGWGPELLQMVSSIHEILHLAL